PTEPAPMHLSLRVLAATIACGAAVGCQEPEAGPNQVTLQTSTYRDFRQLLALEAATAAATVRASLRFPQAARDRSPSVMVVHAMRGYSETNEGYVANELRKSGFVTLTYDSFAAR